MIITPDAHAKLRDLQTRFRKGELGFHFGKLGGCHGAVPRLRPGQEPRHGERAYSVDGLTLFMRPGEHREMEPYTLDYTKGLLMSRFTLDADCDVCAAACKL